MALLITPKVDKVGPQPWRKSMIINGIEYREYDHLYAVSRCGKVLRKGKPYTPPTRKDGYPQCGRQRLLHRVVASVWLRPIRKGEHVHHINHDKKDNRAENLEIISQIEHNLDKHADVIHKLAHSGMSEAGKEKLRNLRLGTTLTEETKAKIGASLKKKGHRPAPRTGKRSAAELERRKLNPPNSTQCIVDGVQYISFAAASEATGVHRFTVRKRCHSLNFPQYQLVSV